MIQLDETFDVDNSNLTNSIASLFQNLVASGLKDLSINSTSSCLLDLDSINITTLEDGITNKLYKITIPYKHNQSIQNSLKDTSNLDNNKQIYLLKIYGKQTELFIDRNQEILNLQSLSNLGLSANIYATLSNGLVYGYTQGSPLATSHIRDAKYMKLIARKLQRLHSADVEIANNHLKANNNYTSKPKFLTSLEQMLDKEKNYKYTKWELKQQISECKQIIQDRINIKQGLVFCHQDLLSGNIIYNKNTNDVDFIDYEYSSYNFRAYDIANHFNEYAGFECDYEAHFPNRAKRKEFLKVYVEAFSKNNSNLNLLNMNVEELSSEVEIFVPISHLFWGIWALLQHKVSEIQFDYLEYSKTRIQEYYTSKHKFWNNNYHNNE